MGILAFVFAFFITLFGLNHTSENTVAIDLSAPEVRLPTVPDPKEKLVDIVKKRRIKSGELSVSINKTAYTVSVLHGDSVLIVYPCVFGFNPIDDKSQEGDGCTPEGRFGIRSKYAHKSWNYFIWIDYPNEESWRRFKQRKANGLIDERATIGGEIGIHGVPDGSDSLIENRTNWTLGCISLKNAHMSDLYHAIDTNTSVYIHK
jgi:murein L,D-transpeptidase YafK